MEDTAEKWKQQALQSLIKRMVAAAMREYYRGPEAAEKWAGMKETLEQAFKTREITDFSIEVDAQGCPTQIVLGTICRTVPCNEAPRYNLVFSLPIQVGWVERAQAAQDEGLLSLASQAVLPVS